VIRQSDMTELGRIIKERREELGLSQRDVVSQIERAGREQVSQATVSAIESGKTKQPKASTLQEIARVLDLDAEYLKVLAGIRNVDAVIFNEGHEIAHIEAKRQTRIQQLVRVYETLAPEDQAKILEMLALLPQLDDRNQDTLLAMARTLLQQQQAA
jgi:transcriptional regulator with XRE-family HTH domain